jgi:hypothetical protein
MNDEHREETIRFSIKGPEGVYRGEATGSELEEHSIFEVTLSNGERFHLEAISAKQSKRYNWVGCAESDIEILVPIVGGIIEKYFRRKRAA